MDLKSLMVDKKSAWVEYPGLDGFEVEVVNLSRKELLALRKKCTSTKFDRRTRQAVDNVDEEKFVTEFTSAVVKNWKGLKLEYLESLILVDLGDKDRNEELPFNLDNAETLVTASTEFDTWLNEVVFDLENFRGGTKKVTPRKAGKVLQE
jgi:hypothetical protein